MSVSARVRELVNGFPCHEHYVVAGNTPINLGADVAGAGLITLFGVTSGIDAMDFIFV